LVVRNRHQDRGGPNWMFLRLRTDEGLVGYGEEAYAVAFDTWCWRQLSARLNRLVSATLFGDGVVDWMIIFVVRWG